VEPAHFDWRWRERPALTLLAWEALARDPLPRLRRIQAESIGTTINFRPAAKKSRRSKHRFLSSKPQLRLEWQGEDGQSETEQPDHSASLGDSKTASTRIRFSVHTAWMPSGWLRPARRKASR
jgi:hypothetical protein